jgi:hypothetical protein
MSRYAERVAAPPARAGPAPGQSRPPPISRPPLSHILQLRAAQAARTEAAAAPAAASRDGLPAQLKAGVEQLSGIAMDDVRVHRNSTEPARLGALAYAKGSDIHLGPGQERHLPHEAWHVVQQKQGRVRPTRPLAYGGINDDPGLEREATEIGAKAERLGAVAGLSSPTLRHVRVPPCTAPQLKPDDIDQDYALPLNVEGKYTGAKGERKGKQAARLNKLAKKVKSIKAPGDAFVGAHLLKAEYGGRDVASNVVSWSPAMEISYSAFEAQMPDCMLAVATAWSQDPLNIPGLAAQGAPPAISFHTEAKFADWTRGHVDIENPARSDAQIDKILTALSRIPISVTTDLDGGRLARTWAIGDISGGRIKITAEPPVAPAQQAGAPAQQPVVVPAAPAGPPASWLEEHMSADD